MSSRTTGLIVTACYALPTVFFLGYVWYHAKPQDHGMDWIGIDLLTFPGCGAPLLFPHGDQTPNSVAALIGLFLNSSAIYLVVTAYQRWAEKLTTQISQAVRGRAIKPPL